MNESIISIKNLISEAKQYESYRWSVQFFVRLAKASSLSSEDGIKISWSVTATNVKCVANALMT